MSLKEGEERNHSIRTEEETLCFSLAAKKKRSKRNRIEAKPVEYDYNDLLQRLYHTLREEDPEGTLLQSQWRITMKTPQIIAGIPGEFVVSNFVELSQLLQREPTHIQAWMQARLNAHSTITATGGLSLSASYAALVSFQEQSCSKDAATGPALVSCVEIGTKCKLYDQQDITGSGSLTDGSKHGRTDVRSQKSNLALHDSSSTSLQPSCALSCLTLTSPRQSRR
ncbi:hypothetical protein CYMTET_31426 [Cymbomonas tetramitiformis]|uniref:Uncharacterized protein n=1 Tax=Cymbomonas tetramitiformis TaxID=36881 RepID=A0AAE0FHX3_9CHLO|nr:hypothetical protein CYMTET_31426 [Cymbomonas tetramitiformis]